MRNIQVDFTKTKGRIKEMNGVGNGPLTGRFCRDRRAEFKRAGIPFSRLHDTEGTMGSGEFVNIHCIFKNFDADVNDPASYNFAATDIYINAILDAGTKVFYRLGETIENREKILRSHTFAPKDPYKWAQICEHIIRHYNEGWADGFYMGIEYWEIWNEPEGAPGTSPNWGGTELEFFELYRITANHLKKCFGDKIKVGGYASTGFYDVNTVGAHAIAPGSSVNETTKEIGIKESFPVSYMYRFFDYITAKETYAPIDFFSWHFYGTRPERCKFEIDLSRELLEHYGMADRVESILDEWNWMECWAAREGKIRKSMVGAAFVSAMHTVMQKSFLSKSMYYDAEPGRLSFCGLFNEYDSSILEKPYFSFLAFNELVKLGTEVESDPDEDGIYTLAATNGNDHAVMLTGYENEEREVSLSLVGTAGAYGVSVSILDENNDLGEICAFSASDPTALSFTVEKNTVYLVKLEKN